MRLDVGSWINIFHKLSARRVCVFARSGSLPPPFVQSTELQTIKAAATTVVFVFFNHDYFLPFPESSAAFAVDFFSSPVAARHCCE